MATEEAQQIYRERAATAELVNAQARNRGLTRFRVPVLFARMAKKRVERRTDADAFVIGGDDETVGQSH